MNFMIDKATRKPNRAHMTDCADYCVAIPESVIIMCPICGQLGHLTNANPVECLEPLRVAGPFQFRCGHFFKVRNGVFMHPNFYEAN